MVIFLNVGMMVNQWDIYDDFEGSISINRLLKIVEFPNWTWLDHQEGFG
jgi:hypothetical protein